MNSAGVFAENEEGFLKEMQKIHTVKLPLGEQLWENALILPLRKNPDYPAQRHAFLGGVCDREGRFIAGSAIEENRFSCPEGYPVDLESVTKRAETVIFGGVFYRHFGVMLLLSLTRFWWIVQKSVLPYRVVFLSEGGKESPAAGYCTAIMELLDIPKDRYEILEEPVLFDRVLVPDEVLRSIESGIDPHFMDPFRFLSEKVCAESGPCEERKLYLSRRHFSKTWEESDGLNEEYYEAFFEKRGFSVIHPQELPLREQIQLLSSASEIVSTYGTLSHLGSLFLRPGTRQIMLLRSALMDNWFPAEAAILEMTGLRWAIVEAVKNPYPVTHELGVYLYAPTKYFRRFLDAEHIPYEEEELCTGVSADTMKEFLQRWVECYRIPWNFRRLGDPSLFPVLEALLYHMTRTRLDPKDYLEPERKV